MLETLFWNAKWEEKKFKKKKKLYECLIYVTLAKEISISFKCYTIYREGEIKKGWDIKIIKVKKIRGRFYDKSFSSFHWRILDLIKHHLPFF